MAVPDVPLDYSARQEKALIDHGLPYLRLADRTAEWRIYEVTDATPIALGSAVLTALGPDSLTLRASGPGSVFVRVRWSPYWALAAGSGCVAPDGDFTRLTLRQAGKVRIVTQFSLGRVGARTARCRS